LEASNFADRKPSAIIMFSQISTRSGTITVEREVQRKEEIRGEKRRKEGEIIVGLKWWAKK